MVKNNYYLMSKIVQDLMFINGQPKSEYFYCVEKCPICNSNKLKYLFNQWGISYQKCKSCEFVFSNPRLTDAGAFTWYNSEYYTAAMQSEHFIAEKYDKYHSISLNKLHFNKFIELFKQLELPVNTSIVDVGCGSGAILHFLKDELGYCNVKGIDLNKSNAIFAKNFRKIDIDLKDVSELDGTQKFDLVITTENIEHISDPKLYIDKLCNIIKTTGYLCITTPHNDNTATSVMGLSGDHFCAPNHQNYFNFKNLSKLLNSKGFDVINHWIDKSQSFNTYAFIKHFLIKRDQIAAIPPNNAALKTIWKWQKSAYSSVILNQYNVNTIGNILRTHNSKKNIKEYLKTFLENMIPFYFSTHQILITRFNGK